MHYSVVIPIFNDVSALPEFLQRFFSMLDARGDDAELIIVDDGSSDDIWFRLREITSLSVGRRIKLLRLAFNHGQQVATLCGIFRSRENIVVTLDADLQHPPEAIANLVDELECKNLELVYGAGAAGHGLLRRFLSSFYRAMASLFGSAFFHASSFRVMRRSLLDRLFPILTTKTVSIDDCLRELLPRAGHVRVVHQRRAHGASSYSWPRLLSMLCMNAYYSRQLLPVAWRIFLLSSLLVSGNAISGNMIFSWETGLIVLVVAGVVLITSHVITQRRLPLPLTQQFIVREECGF